MTNPGRLRIGERFAWAKAGVALLVAFGCDAIGDSGLVGEGDLATVEKTQQALIVENVFYDNAPSVHVVVKQCTQPIKNSWQTVDCKVDAPYVLIGGGGRVEDLTTGWGAFLTESRPVDTNTWRASSIIHIYDDPHTLTTYAVGVRLDGVSPVALVNKYLRTVFTNSSTASHPEICPSSSEPVWTNISGGALVSWTGYGNLLTRLDSGCAAAKDHIYYSPATITLYQRQILREPIEGFGMLDVKEQTVTAPPVASGLGGALAGVNSDWVIAAYGGQAYYQGMGRMLWSLGPRNMDLRTPIAWSRDQKYSDSGSTAVTWTQIRKRPSSHSLCATGSALASDMGTCVSSICTSRPSCCSSTWDATCVGLVKTKCGSDCALLTCSAPSYHPEVWSSYLTNNNCYSYANNVRKTQNTGPSPGIAAGRPMGYGSCTDLKAAIAADGLIPINTKNDACTEGRSKVAYALASVPLETGFGYHFYRQDANANNNNWSQKDGSGPVTNVDTTGQPIVDPEVAAGRYNVRGTTLTFCGYACTCSSSTEGQGHAIIDTRFLW